MLIEIREQAREDLKLGFQFYEEQAPGLGQYFLECLFTDIDSLTKFAGIHETADGFQRLLSKRFPFAIYYTVVGEQVRVSAVLDCRRDPSWIQRCLRRMGDH
jgi:plasmid stabilization system protein ParE